jgi:RNA polymerase-binding transcription factor DksA
MTDPAARLRTLREATSRRIADLRAELADVIDSASSTTGDDEHDPEGATIGFERAQAAALLAAAEAQLRDIDAAGARLTTGTYGSCAVCGKPIAAERLKARPTAERCLTCAASR